MINREKITKLIKQYDLSADDVYVHDTEGFKVIKRRGYKKIQSKLKISIHLELAHASGKEAVVIATGSLPNKETRSTFGEASPDNSTFEYPVSVAQKRAESRLIIELSDLYESGWIGEEEIDFTMKASRIAKKMTKKGTNSVDDAITKMGLGKEDEKKE